MPSCTFLAPLVLALSIPAYGADNFIGTWKMDPQQSKMTFVKDPGGSPTTWSETYTIASDGSDGVILTKDYVSPQGVSSHIVGACKFDGKDHRVAGHPLPGATRALKRVNSHTWETTLKSEGKIVQEAREVVSEDGNTLTVTGTMMINGVKHHDFISVYKRK
jgi:hypothetical protein